MKSVTRALSQDAGTKCTQLVLQNKTEYWGNSYSYDAWGNLLGKTVTKCGAENLSVTADTHNWIHASGTDYRCDAAGNMTFDATANLTYNFDPENRITGAAGYTYTYDGDGNRVRKSNGTTASSGTLYWYMTPGVVAESDLAGTLKSEYIFFDGERAARKDFPGNTVAYYFSDHLKTASVITSASGTITAESDYYPWGGELQFVNNDSNDYKFTGSKRDNESGLDLMGARYYSSARSRFATTDPIYIEKKRLADPQLWNLYQYARANPTKFTDGTGLDIKLDCSKTTAGGCNQTVTDANNRKGAQFAVSRNEKSGILEVKGKVDVSKLSDRERALYNAITDTTHHATLEVGGQSDSVHLGRFDGNGHNTLDRADLDLMNKVNVQITGEIIAHEGLEAYDSTFGNGQDYEMSHGYANQFFGDVVTGPVQYTFTSASHQMSFTQDTTYQKLGVTVQVKIVETPQPPQTVPAGGTRGTIVDIKPVQK